MQPAVQASYQMVLVAIKMITREFKDWGVIWNGLGKYVERITSNHFPGCPLFVLHSNTQRMMKESLCIYSVPRKCRSASGSDIVFVRGGYFRECKCQPFRFALGGKSKWCQLLKVCCTVWYPGPAACEQNGGKRWWKMQIKVGPALQRDAAHSTRQGPGAWRLS